MTDKELLNRWIPVAEFISRIFSDDVEVVLHDVTGDIKNSVIAIFNNHVSGRNVGDSTTDLGLRFLSEEEFKELDFYMNYPGVTHNGSNVRSSTYFIRNEEGKVIGHLCVNVNLTEFKFVKKYMEHIISFEQDMQNSGAIETLKSSNLSSNTVSDIIYGTIAEYTESCGKRLADFTMADNIRIVAELDEKNVFSFKSGISKVSLAIGVSEPTIYRYLARIREKPNSSKEL